MVLKAASLICKSEEDARVSLVLLSVEQHAAAQLHVPRVDQINGH